MDDFIKQIAKGINKWILKPLVSIAAGFGIFQNYLEFFPEASEGERLFVTFAIVILYLVTG